MIRFDDPVKRRGTPQGAVNMETDEVSAFPRNPGIGTSPPKKKVSDANLLTEDLLSLAPNLYNAVKLRGHKAGETALGPNGVSDLSLLDVSSIEISVKAANWDRTLPSKRVSVLKRTWEFLQVRYPSLTQMVALSFDDGRPNLELRF